MGMSGHSVGPAEWGETAAPSRACAIEGTRIRAREAFKVVSQAQSHSTGPSSVAWRSAFQQREPAIASCGART